MGPARHVALLPAGSWQTLTWPVPFANGIDQLLKLRGRQVVVLVSGDPFWFGAGSVLAQHVHADEWTAIPGPSCFSLAASALGWPLEKTVCLGLHAAPLARMKPHLHDGQRLIVTLRDGDALSDLAAYLSTEGFGRSEIHVMEALGGPRERCSTHIAEQWPDGIKFVHPVCAAIEARAPRAASLPCSSGIDDDWFDHDGQITKRPIRALTLSALAPRPGEHLWDIGGGSGSIAIEWLLTHPSVSATSIEVNADRAARITQNAMALGVDRLAVVEGAAPDVLEDLPAPDAVFVGGGLSVALLARLTALPLGTRLVINAVTLEAEALLQQAHEIHGGDLLRIDLAHAAPLGSKRGWRAAYPIVQWSVTL